MSGGDNAPPRQNSIINMTNQDIKAMLENEKADSTLYFDSMDNAFINEIANRD